MNINRNPTVIVGNPIYKLDVFKTTKKGKRNLSFYTIFNNYLSSGTYYWFSTILVYPL